MNNGYCSNSYKPRNRPIKVVQLVYWLLFHIKDLNRLELDHSRVGIGAFSRGCEVYKYNRCGIAAQRMAYGTLLFLLYVSLWPLI